MEVLSCFPAGFGVSDLRRGIGQSSTTTRSKAGVARDHYLSSAFKLALGELTIVDFMIAQYLPIGLGTLQAKYHIEFETKSRLEGESFWFKGCATTLSKRVTVA